MCYAPRHAPCTETAGGAPAARLDAPYGSRAHRLLGVERSFFPAIMSNIAVVAMVCIIMSFAVGVGNVEGFIISEIMPVYAKDTLMSVGQPLNWISNLTVSTFFPIVFASLGRGTYLLFVLLTAFFGYFTYFKLPETKGKTIAQITKDFEKYY